MEKRTHHLPPAEQARIKLANFEFSGMENDHLQAWHCAKPGTIHQSFDIVITSFGIAVMGDIAPLMFNAGRQQGISWLASDDIEYLFDALHPIYQVKRVNKATVFDYTWNNWFTLIREQLLFNLSAGPLTTVRGELHKQGLSSSWLAPDSLDGVGTAPDGELQISIIDVLCKQYGFADLLKDPKVNDMVAMPIDLEAIRSTLVDLVNLTAELVPEESDLMAILERAHDGASDLCDWKFTLPCNGVMTRLRLVNEAAKIIRDRHMGQLSTEKEALKTQ